jgi:sensor histidine kinase YesM
VHPILSNRRTLALYLAVWLFVGLLVETPFILSMSSQWISILISDIPLYFLYAFMCLSSYYLCRTFPLHNTKWYILIILFLFAAGIVGGIATLVSMGWVRFVDTLQLGPPLIVQYEPWIAGIYSILILIFLLVAALHYVIITFEQSQEVERQALELKLLAQDAELRALRAQIDPHFLFNSLNSISALTTSNPEKARQMTLMLADFLRKSLDHGARNHIPLADELSLVNNFLTIEQVRFGSRLKVEQQIDHASLNCPVPPLILQPLVENAVCHGIAHLIEGGTILIRTERHGERLRLSIENPVDPDCSKKKGSGLGLRNVRTRIDTLYGNEARVDVEESNSYFKVLLTFPACEQK